MVNVVFLHPDLGIGGAERSVVDAALALRSCGHCVQFVTSHHDTGHCFQETRDGTLHVTSVGDWLPRSILGRCHALCAYVRMIYAALYLVFFSGIQFDIVFCDQISACIPVLRLSKAKVLFYCHFPDMLLTARQSWLKAAYRCPIDWFEEKTTGLADCILVNSKFTAGIFKDTFTSLNHIEPKVLYPIPNFSTFDKPIEVATSDLIPPAVSTLFLSINRYERKKNLGLALQALAKVKEWRSSLEGIHLILAGGYDERVSENREHYQELCELREELQLTDSVSFIRSFSDPQKRTLLHNSSCLLYSPEREHFGIVPIEAMYMECPVIAVRSGGPLETVADEETGFLCQPEPDSFAQAMMKFITDSKLSQKMGKAAKKHVISNFSFNSYTRQLNAVIEKLFAGGDSRK